MNAVVLNGFFVGLIYGLLGLGLVVVYRGSSVINFAYGETGMLGAFFFTDMRFGVGNRAMGAIHDHGLWLAVPVGIAISAAAGVATELLVVRRMRNAPRIRPLVGTLAVASLFYIYAARRWGTDVRFARPLVRGDGFNLVGLQVSTSQLLILVVSVMVLVGLWALYKYTAFGLRLRLVAIDPYAAGLIGVNVNTTSAATWALAGGLAGLSAMLIAPLVAFNIAFMTQLGIRGLAAALIGGLTNPFGAFAAGIAIGIAEGVIAFKTPVSGITDVAIAALVLGLMLGRPAGLSRLAAH